MDGRANGFTIIELLVVMAVVGIVLAIARPVWQVDHLEEAGRKVFSDLHLIRMRAINENHDYRLLIDAVDGCHAATGTSYRLHGDTDDDGVCDSGEALVLRDLARDFRGVTLSTTTNPKFYADGTTANAGTITVSDGDGGAVTITFSIIGRIVKNGPS